MAFGIGTLLYTSLLLINSICILSEDRFLSRIGWGANGQETQWGQQANESVKYKLLTLMHAVRTLLRMPLVFLNVLVICYELIAG